MKLIDTVSISGFLYNDVEEYGFKVTNKRRDGSVYYDVEPLLLNELYGKMNDHAVSLDKALVDVDNCEDTDYEFEQVGIQLYFTEKETSLDEAKEYLILDVLGGLNGSEGWYGYSEYTILGYRINNFTVGGHDILKILESNEGKYCHIVLNIYE